MKQVFYKSITKNSHLYVWKLESSVSTLLKQIKLSSLETKTFLALKTKKRKLEFLACSLALKNIFSDELRIQHHKSGKPFIKEVEHLSISHSHKYIAIAFGRTEIGIDIELPQEKMLKLIPRILSEKENIAFLKNPSTEQACKLWGTKESILKYIGDKNLDYRNDIRITGNSNLYFDQEFEVKFEKIEKMILTYVMLKTD